MRSAARKVGLSRESAYRLRDRPGAGSFAAAWDKVLGRGAAIRRKVTPEELRQRAVFGLLKPLMYLGRHVATARKPDNSALLRFLAQLDRARGAPDPHGPDSMPFALVLRQLRDLSDSVSLIAVAATIAIDLAAFRWLIRANREDADSGEWS